MPRAIPLVATLVWLTACHDASRPNPADADPCAVADARAAGVDARDDEPPDAPDAQRPDAAVAPETPSPPVPGYYDARSAAYGAVGDGTTDDTAAIQRALDAAARYARSAAGVYSDDGLPGHGGIVYLAPGNYLVRGHLAIAPYVTLRGAFVPPGATFVPSTAGATNAVLLAVEGAGNADGTPFISVAAGATLEGVTIYYPEQTNTDPPIAYPWTVREGGIQVSVLDVVFVNAYQAVDASSAATGRHLLRGLYGQPLRCGVRVDHSLDVGRIEATHFSPIWQPDPNSPARRYQLASGVAFELRRADWEQLRDVTATGYAVGLLLGQSPLPCAFVGLCGGSNGLITNLGFDAGDVGIELANGFGAGSGFHVDGYQYAASASGAHRLAVWHPSGTQTLLVVSGAVITGAYAQAVLWEGDGRLTLDASTFPPWQPGRAAVDLRAGAAIVRGTTFAPSAGVAVAASAGVRLVAVDDTLHGNRITGAATVSGNTP